MLFVISPAKTLDYDTPPTTERHTRPAFVDRSAQLIEVLRQKTPADIGTLMDISDALAVLNVGRYQHWSPRFTKHNSKQAVLAFMGDVYEGLNAASFGEDELDYTQRHLRILSGLYGLLKPLDLMQPYRLEMGTRLATPAGKSLYDFWGDTLTEALNAELAKDKLPVLVNLASDEYFKAVKPKKLKARLVECVFEDWKTDRYKIISFFAKRARGLMVRYAVLNRLRDPADLKGFDLDGYGYVEEASTPDRLVFRRKTA